MSNYCKNCYELTEKLEAKEQECEELKKQLERKEENYQKLLSKSNKYIHNLVDENVRDISNLARQLDQLKADREKALKQLEFVRTLNTVREAEIRKLKQTIAYIKEIAEKHKSTAHCDYLTDMDNILQKISEGERNNEN